MNNSKLKFRIWSRKEARYIANDGYTLVDGRGVVWYCLKGKEEGDVILIEADYAHKPIIEQFTGFQDNSGRDIYEGDIVDGTDHGSLEYPDDHYRVVIEWDDEGGKWNARDPFSNEKFELGDYRFIDHVVGNIHEHPSLINSE